MEKELNHHGILGQKWGVRRFQNEDGTWTNAGKRRYSDDAPDIAGMIRDRVSRERKSKEYRDDYYNRKIRKYESRLDGSRMQSVKESGIAVVSKLLSSESSLLSGPNRKKNNRSRIINCGGFNRAAIFSESSS